MGGESTFLSFVEDEYPLSVKEEEDYIRSLEGNANNVMFLALDGNEIVGLSTITSTHKIKSRHEGELGIVQEGALADLIVVDLQKPHLQPLHDVVSNLVYCGKASDVETVVVDGRVLVEGRRLLGVDLPQLFRDVDAAVRRIING